LLAVYRNGSREGPVHAEAPSNTRPVYRNGIHTDSSPSMHPDKYHLIAKSYKIPPQILWSKGGLKQQDLTLQFACMGDKPSQWTNKIALDKIIGVQITK